jgi:hypothetical protein
MAQGTAVSRQAADRFAFTFAEFVAGLQGALALAPLHHDASRWQQKALPLLKRDLSEVHSAMKSFESGNQEQLVQIASSALSLAKNLDGYPLDFAGEESGKELTEHLRFVVMAAWQVLSGAGRV